ncbi:MAG TPA: 16S rRNA (guanine(527)-N(7))-methyltransferase RsmG [Bacteroidales bacterium]|nr:16S rRNA (guanine(527)-N(7))-methyltransferase RsmG [Bacteroidales bacterium]
MLSVLDKYFHLTGTQEQQFLALGSLYPEWNAKINVILRKDINNLYEHHILHSLAIAKVINFKDGTQVMDVGTGGGFPGIPLAVLFPNVSFLLVDSVGKKVKVATEVAAAAGLTNVRCVQERVENISEKFDFVVSRAVMPLPDLVRLTKKNIMEKQRNALPNGLICLKGGELFEELKPFKRIAEVMPLSQFFSEDYFKTKKVVYVPI